MDIIIKKQELENISSLLPTIIYNELLKFTEEPISIEGDVTSPTTESVVETKIDKSVLLIKIKLFKKALEKDKSNKVLKIKIKLFEKELTKYANGGGVSTIKERVIDYYINNSDNEDLINLMGVSDVPNLKQVAEKWVNNRDTYYDKIFSAIDGIHNRTWAENKFEELGLEKFSNGGGVEDVVITIESGNDGELEEVWRGKNTIKNQPIYNSVYKNEIKKGKTVFLYENGVLMYSDFADLDEGYYKNGGGVGDVYKLIDGENTWYLTYLDSTHFFLSNTKEYKGSPYHIGEFRSRPFYNEVLSWLNSNKGKMANGGGVGELKEGDFVWNAIGKKLLVREVNNDEYLLEGFGSSFPKPFSKYKVNNYIKSGEWTLNPKMAKGGGVDYNENREMVLNDNKQIAHHTKELQSAVKGKNVPAWVVAKVNRSASDLSDSTHYMEGQGESYADGGSIKIGDKVMLPEIKMRDGKIQFEKVENGEVIEIQDGIYSVLNPKTNRIHQVSLNQIKFNNGGGVAIVGGEKVTEQQKDAIIKIINTYNESWYSVSKYSDGSVAISLVVKNNDPKHKEKYVEYIGAIGKDGNYKFRDMEKYLDDISEYRPKFTYAKGGSMASGGVFNVKYLDTISSDKKNKILKNIANNYGFSIAEALAEVVDADAEMLYEYISNDQSLRMSVYNDIEGGKFAKGTTVKGGVEEWSIVTKNEEEHFDNYADARGFWNGLSKLEKANGQFFRKVWVNGEEGEVEILGGKLYAKGNTVKSGVKKWINPDRISKLEYEIATIKKNAILKKDIQSDADRKRIKEKILKPMEEQLELLKKGIDTPFSF